MNLLQRQLIAYLIINNQSIVYRIEHLVMDMLMETFLNLNLNNTLILLIEELFQYPKPFFVERYFVKPETKYFNKFLHLISIIRSNVIDEKYIIFINNRTIDYLTEDVMVKSIDLPNEFLLDDRIWIEYPFSFIDYYSYYDLFNDRLMDNVFNRLPEINAKELKNIVITYTDIDFQDALYLFKPFVIEHNIIPKEPYFNTNEFIYKILDLVYIFPISFGSIEYTLATNTLDIKIFDVVQTCYSNFDGYFQNFITELFNEICLKNNINRIKIEIFGPSIIIEYFNYFNKQPTKIKLPYIKFLPLFKFL